MDINASIIDQRLIGIMDEIRSDANEILNISDDSRLKSLSFVYLCVKTILDLETTETFDCLVEGGDDFGVDAIHLSEEIDGEFHVTLFQCKYKRDLKGESQFPETGINKLINAIRYMFDPSATLQNINSRLLTKVEEARSMIRDGLIPRVHAIACNNGKKWNHVSEEAIIRSGFSEQVNWEHVNHELLVKILQRVTSVSVTLRFIGKAIIEDMNYSRVCIGRIPVLEISDIMKTHGERLLERNIRRYLGLHGNRVNEGIRSTLRSESPSNFYFFNNGLTLVCSDFSYNALQSNDYQVNVENLQIVNGGQTCMTILKTIEEIHEKGEKIPQDASVLVRLYKLPKSNDDIVVQITHATNSQNPVDLKDLRSNHEKQIQLELALKDMGYYYRRKRTDSQPKPTDITSGAAAEAILSIWRESPHQAKFLIREHFGKLYHEIFKENLNATQLIVAVLLYRIAENRRRRPHQNDPTFVRYASCFIAMQMGRRLLAELKIDLMKLDHTVFERAKDLIDTKGETYFHQSINDINNAIKSLYSSEDLSLQQLSATFRRGDLIDYLRKAKIE